MEVQKWLFLNGLPKHSPCHPLVKQKDSPTHLKPNNFVELLLGWTKHWNKQSNILKVLLGEISQKRLLDQKLHSLRN